MRSPDKQPWKVSLHGGHSSAYCDHAHSTLRELIEAAIAFGYTTFGVTEHAPRVEEHRLFEEERAMGWDIPHLDHIFEQYAAELRSLQDEYADRITILRGFEAEVIPEANYVEVMRGYAERYQFDYMVGSVHWVNGHIIDHKREYFEQALAVSGSLEALAVKYYETLAEMALRLNPEVIGHFDLIRCSAPDEASVSTQAVRCAALAALEAVREAGAILDVNTAGYRKGLGRPYPAPWIVEAARDMGIGFCFGDDSHRAKDVGAGVVEAREYLLELGVREIAVLQRTPRGIEQLVVSLAG